MLPQWWKSHFLLVEFVIAVVISLAFFCWGVFLDGEPVITEILKDNRGQVYGTLASIYGALLGFAITATSIVVGFSSSPKLTVLRSSEHYKTLWKVFFSAIWWLGFATLTSLAGLVFDREVHSTSTIFYIFIFASLISMMRIARTMWVLERVTEILAEKSKESSD